MNRLAKVSARWLANIGFSIGINDVTPSMMLVNTKERMVQEAYDVCDDYINQAKLGKLENLPGSTQEGTLETKISGTLSAVRAAVGDICMRELSRHNAPLIMATCGSKGESICFVDSQHDGLTLWSYRFRHQCRSDGSVGRTTNHRW
jgi:DNA-directed RNA polymerase III subunit RPC1